MTKIPVKFQSVAAPQDIRPTDEQAAIIAAARTGADLVVIAGAGSGKTSTQRLVGRAMPSRRGHYIAYNKAIANDAQGTFPANVRCSTAHSLAFRAVGFHYQSRLTGERVPAWRVAEILGVRGIEVEADEEKNLLGDLVQFPPTPIMPKHLAIIASDTVRSFCWSADAVITQKHVPWEAKLSKKQSQHVADIVVPYAKRIWEDVNLREGGRMRFEHDHYLKMWQLSGVQLPTDFVLLDEAQDCQPAGTMVWVPAGEKWLQKPIEELKAGDSVISYTMSGLRLRMRGSKITSVGSHRHTGEMIRVRTESASATTMYTPGHICIARIGPALKGKTILYLMRRGTAWRVGVTSAYHGKNRPSTGLGGRLREEDADAIWILGAYKDKRSALTAEAFIPARFGIPEMRFRDNGQRSFGQAELSSFWNEMGDLTDKADTCLRYFGRDIRYPLATRSLVKGTRNEYLLYTRSTTVRACNLIDGMQILNAKPLMARRNQAARRFADPAWEPITAYREKDFDNYVYSIEVEDDHTYVGDDLVTHNCNPVIAAVINQQLGVQKILVGDPAQQIYAWRGAVDAMKGFPGKRLPLSKSFRFGPAIAEQANAFLELLGDFRITGNEKIESTVGPVESPRAILCRTNAEALAQVVMAQSIGVKAALVGGGRELVALAHAAIQLQHSMPTDHRELMLFRSWSEVQEFVQAENAGYDLKVFVKLIDTYGAERILQIIDSLYEEPDAELIISTAHKAKGREWESVKVAPDFELKPDAADASFNDGEIRLAYVTVTRAKLRLDPGGLDWINN